MSKIGYIRVSTEHQETARQPSEQVQTREYESSEQGTQRDERKQFHP